MEREKTGTRKRLFGWCPRPVNPMTLAIRRYSVPLAAGVIATVLLVSFFLLSSGSLMRTPPSVPEVPIVTPTPTPLAPTPSPSNSSSSHNQSTLLTEDQALAIAMPLIQQYASEHNRVISSVNPTFCASVRDIYGSRTDNPTPFEPIRDPQKIISYPQWTVQASFEPTGDYAPGHIPMPSSAEGWVIGYSVLIWADNGQIRSANARACV